MQKIQQTGIARMWLLRLKKQGGRYEHYLLPTD
nr:MAG TPA: hypothetical protein [Myoviridae sp. ctDOq19]